MLCEHNVETYQRRGGGGSFSAFIATRGLLLSNHTAECAGGASAPAGPAFDNPPCRPAGGAFPPLRGPGGMPAAPAGALVGAWKPCGALYAGLRLCRPASYPSSWKGLLSRFLSLGAALRSRLASPRGPSEVARVLFLAPGGWASPISTSSTPGVVLGARPPAAASGLLHDVGAGLISSSHAHLARAR